MENWQELQDAIGIFTDKTFGVSSNARAKALHLAEEAREAADDPADVIEWADCLMLLLDGARKAGFSTADLYAATLRKLEINKSRTWGAPDENGVVRHVETK